MKHNPVTYARVRMKIRSGDLMLFRARQKLSNRLIARSSNSYYCHAAMAVWVRNVLMICEMKQKGGGRIVNFSTQIAGYPGQWDWYKLKEPPGFDRQGAITAMIRTAGEPYGWWAVKRLVLERSIFTRWLFRPPVNDEENGRPLHCSGAISRALRVGGGVDPMPNKSDWATDPANLSQASILFEYQGTLYLTPQQATEAKKWKVIV